MKDYILFFLDVIVLEIANYNKRALRAFSDKRIHLYKVSFHTKINVVLQLCIRLLLCAYFIVFLIGTVTTKVASRGCCKWSNRIE